MPAALFLSPHLDDVAFSCGGTLWRLRREAGWDVTLATVFTASVPGPLRGFARRCQTDKGLAASVDYLALRRAEDRAAAAELGAPELWHGDFAEAPHRGYESPAELFAGTRGDDEIWRPVAGKLRALLAGLAPDLVFAPQGLGNHVDHRQVIRAVLELGEGWVGRVLWYRDTPYAIREPAVTPAPELPAGLREVAVDISGEPLARKVAASGAYTTQIGFQFGGERELGDRLRAFHREEARRAGLVAAGVVAHAERFLAPPGFASWPEFLLRPVTAVASPP